LVVNNPGQPFGRDRGRLSPARRGAIRLVADGAHEIHPLQLKPLERLEYPIPAAATADGSLELEFQPETGRPGNGHSLQVAEVAGAGTLTSTERSIPDGRI
jgi:hypothetical protein